MADGADTKQRFEISVPFPKARINLGQPETKDGDPSFGYTGLSLQSDWDFYVDVNKDTFHQGTNVLHQAGGVWRQYADGPMWISTLAAQSVTSGEQLALVAGAPYGNNTGLDHGWRVRHHQYNNLGKHYRVEEIQNGLFEFFYGRCDRITEKGSGFAYTLNTFDSEKAAVVEANADLKGFRAMVKASEDALGIAGNDSLWLEQVTDAKAKAGGPKSLDYGFSPYLKRFDPYNMIDASALTGISWLAAKMRNGLTIMRRTVDVMRRIGACITDNFVIARILKLAESVAGFERAWSAMDRVIARHPFQAVRWVDEYNSGFVARVTAAGDQGGSASTGNRKAAIVSGSAPFALEHGDSMTLTGGTRGSNRNISVVATHAELAASAAPDTSWTGTITLDRGAGPEDIAFSSADTSSLTTMLAKLPPAVADGGKIKLRSTKKGSAQRVSIRGDKATLAKLGFGADSLPRSASGAPEAAHSPTFPIDAGALTLAVSGVGTLTIDFAANPASDMTALVARIESAWSGVSALRALSATVASNAGGKLKLETSRALTMTASTRALFESLGFAAASQPVTIESGAPAPANNVADSTAVTADEVRALLAGSGVTVTSADDAVTVESTTAGSGSFVKGSGDLATKLGLAKEDVGGHGFAGWNVAKTDFSVMNHELQKLPEDARNLTRPMTEFLEDIEQSMSSLEKALESLVEAIPVKILDLPGPPAAIGLIAKDGITLGTPDRIVGAAGGGFVFVADGGTGQRDRGKFIPGLEKSINFLLEWKPKIFGGPDAAKAPENVGFRVCSDTAVQLTASTTAELLALGRATVGADAVGVGVARVGASRSVELCGHEKVAIGARAKVGDTAVPAGGRVELMGNEIAIGVHDANALATFGIQPKGQPKRKWPDKTDKDVELSDRLWRAQGNAPLQPLTKKVALAATDEIMLHVGEMTVKLHKDDGLTIGWAQNDAVYQARKQAYQDELARLQLLQPPLQQRLAVAALELAAAQADPDTFMARMGLFGDSIQDLQNKKADIEKQIAQLAEDIAAAQARIPATREALLVPALKIQKESITLGFNKNKDDGKLEDGPHLKITAEGVWLETGKPDQEVSIGTADGRDLKVFAKTAWTAKKDVEVKPEGKLALEPTGDVSMKGANITFKPDGTVKIG
jgi:hypothetical protein